MNILFRLFFFIKNEKTIDSNHVETLRTSRWDFLNKAFDSVPNYSPAVSLFFFSLTLL